MDRYRLISSIVVLFVYLLAMYPWQTIIGSIILIIAYVIIANIGNNSRSSFEPNQSSQEIRRKNALSEARIYLAPYKDIWRNLKLSNKYCVLRLGSDGKTITARESVSPKRVLRILRSNVHTYADLWDMFCNVFDHNTTFDRIVELCNLYNLTIDIQGSVPAKLSSDNVVMPKNGTIPAQVDEQKEKIDINNASEIEITALPGISIVMAKKLIKKRDEINGFKSVEDVCLFLKLKPHIETQVKQLICVNKKKGSNNIKLYNERSVDL